MLMSRSQLIKISATEAESGGYLVGSMIWMFAHEDYPDYDNYTVRRSRP
jgi:hypothetical protein